MIWWIIGSFSLDAALAKKSLNIVAVSDGSSVYEPSSVLTDPISDCFWQPLPAPA